MNIKTLAKKWLQAFMPQSPYLGPTMGNFRGVFGSSRYDYTTEAGELWSNSIVSVCINRKATMLQNMRLVIQRYDSAKDKWTIATGPQAANALNIFKKPNAYYNGTALMQAILLSWDCRGQYFLYKRRDNAGRIIGFWYLPHQWVQILSDRDNPNGEKLITHYRYSVPGAAPVDLPYDDVLMVRSGIDPNDPRQGISNLYAQLREICSDNEASNWLASLLRNGATPSVLLTPKVPPAGGIPPTPEQMSALRGMVNEQVADARGQAALVPFPMDTIPITFNPKDMDLGGIRSIPTDRICAALGGDPMAFGLPSDSKTYSNLEEATDALGHMTVLPMAWNMAAQWSETLLPAFGLDPQIFRYGWDTTDVFWLADETLSRDENARANFQSGILDRYQAKEAIMVVPDPADKGVTYFDLQARASAGVPLTPSKSSLSDWAVRMGEANIARLNAANRSPEPVKHKAQSQKADAAQAAHNRNINSMDRAMMNAFEDYKSNNITLDELSQKLSDIIFKTHKSQYRLGFTVGGGTPTDKQLDDFARAVTDIQQEFLQGFIGDIEDGRYDAEDGTLDLDGALRQRSRLYGANTSSSASAGFVEAGGDGTEYSWQLGIAEHCADCEYISSLSPFDKSTLFTHPRGGDTVCLGNCKCKLVRNSDGLAPFGPVE